jgi:hypothetical protein
VSIMSKPREKSAPGSEPKTEEGHPTREEIEVRAYQIYLERGGAPGQDVDDWLQAERELVEKYEKTTSKAKTVAT